MKKHLCVSIDGLIREISSRRTEKAKNKLATAFLSEVKQFPEPYIQLITELGGMKSKGRDVFVGSECDNVQPNGSCGGHTD